MASPIPTGCMWRRLSHVLRAARSMSLPDDKCARIVSNRPDPGPSLIDCYQLICKTEGHARSLGQLHANEATNEQSSRPAMLALLGMPLGPGKCKLEHFTCTSMLGYIPSTSPCSELSEPGSCGSSLQGDLGPLPTARLSILQSARCRCSGNPLTARGAGHLINVGGHPRRSV